ERAVGSMLTDVSGSSVRIVGVVRTRSYRALEGSERPMVYYPMSRSIARGFYAAVRARGQPAGFDGELAQTLAAAGRTTKLEVTTLDALLARALAPDRMIAALIAACGALALALAAVGVYGVMADLV